MVVRFRTAINVGWSMCVTLLQYPDIFFIELVTKCYRSLTGHVVSCPVCVFYEMGERSRPGRGTSSQAPGQACHQRGVAPGESCDASGARDLSGEEGFRRAVRHSGLSPLSLPHQEGHTWCSRTFVTVKEGMEARTEYGLELKFIPCSSCPNHSHVLSGCL